MRFTNSHRPSIVFLPREDLAVCRCGMASLDEACLLCEQLVCQECAVFVDPTNRQPTRPSYLLSRGISRDFMAHRRCVSLHDAKSMPCVYATDIPLMVRILKGGKSLGKSLPSAR